MERTKINFDELEELFPGESITIGNQPITIPPLTFEQIMSILKRGRAMIDAFQKSGVTWDNLSSYESILKMTEIMITSFPEILEEASNISLDDLKKLPFPAIMDIVECAIKANVSSRDALVKNLKSLVKKFQEVMKNTESEKSKVQGEVVSLKKASSIPGTPLGKNS